MERKIVIDAKKRPVSLFRELWQYRELFYFLAWRNILVRYKQTVLGIVWSVFRPIMIMIVFTIIFGKIAKLPSGDIPYALLVFVALLPWQFFSSTLSESSNSLISNTSLVSKVYIPRLIIPTSTVMVSLVDFVIAFTILIFLMVWYGIYPSWRLLAVPALLILAITISLGLGYFISALNVKYRDFRFVVPFAIQLGLYISPVGFNTSVVTDSWRLLYSMNPMVGVIDGFRWAVLGGEAQLYLPGLFLSIVIGLFLFTFGIFYFSRSERNFSDYI